MHGRERPHEVCRWQSSWISISPAKRFRDPQAGVARLRLIGPAVATKFPIIGRVWVTTTYEATARVLKDSAHFTLRKEDGAPAGLPWWMPKVIGASPTTC